LNIFASILISIGTCVLGIACGWFITWRFYKKSNKQQSEEHKSQLKEIQQSFTDYEAGKLSIVQLNKIVEDKVFEKNSDDPLNYKICPKCGSKNLKRTGHSMGDSLYFFIECKKCDWSEGTE
jgi:hypothetical protein